MPTRIVSTATRAPPLITIANSVWRLVVFGVLEKLSAGQEADSAANKFVRPLLQRWRGPIKALVSQEVGGVFGLRLLTFLAATVENAVQHEIETTKTHTLRVGACRTILGRHVVIVCSGKPVTLVHK